MAQRKVTRRTRASIMIFAVVTMAAIGTTLIASMDLGRLAYLKAKDSERRLRYQAHIDSIRAEYEEKLYREGVGSYNLTIENNGIRSNAVGALDTTWESPRSYRIQITSQVDRKTKSATLQIGKRMMVNASDFSLVARQITTAGKLTLDGDAMMGTTTSFTETPKLRGDVYGVGQTGPTIAFSQGGYIGGQPEPKITLNPSAYSAVADVTTSGTLTMSSPSFGIPILTSRTYYHTGDLTLSGTYNGKGTIFVDGVVTIQNFRPLTGLDHAIIVATGGIVLEGRTITAVMITSGAVTTNATGNIRISGSIATNVLNATQDLDITQDTFISVNPLLNDFYRIPGAW